jgi:hypothetical protein
MADANEYDREFIEFLQSENAALKRKLAALEAGTHLYSIGDLVKMTGLSRWTVLRMLRRLGVQMVKANQKLYVPRSEIVERWAVIMDRPEPELRSDYDTGAEDAF